jgi:hypothetical protein
MVGAASTAHSPHQGACGRLLSRRSFARHIHSTSLPQKFTSAGQALQRANMATNCVVDSSGQRWCKSCPFGDKRAQSGHVAAMIHLPCGASDADRKRDARLQQEPAFIVVCTFVDRRTILPGNTTA